MVSSKAVTGGLVVVTILFAGLAGYLFVSPPAGATKTLTSTSTQVSTVLSTVSSGVLSTITSTATSLVSTTSTLLSTVTSTSSTTLLSTTTATTTATATGPYTVNLAYKAGTGFYLTDSTGLTLYFRATDPGNGTSTCTGGCVTVWPLFYAAGTVTVPPGMSASSFGMATRTDGGKQTTYNGYPLYYYENDKAAGQITGQGKGNFYPCCSLDQTTTTTATTSTTTTTTSATTSTQVAKVSIPAGTGSSSGLNFSPNVITVKIGVNNTITWTNNDSVTHTVNSISVPSGASQFADNSLAAGGTFTVTLTVPGTYQYICNIHPWMSGSITVTT